MDGLHLRSNLPRRALAELHGNVFVEKCESCGHEIFHEQDLGGMGCRPTGNRCPECNTGALHDTVLDWDTPISEAEMAIAEEQVALADMVLCLGTSLRIIPAAELPLLVGSARDDADEEDGKICIVNLQDTPLGSRADLVLHCKVDEVMQYLLDSFTHPTKGEAEDCSDDDY